MTRNIRETYNRALARLDDAAVARIKKIREDAEEKGIARVFRRMLNFVQRMRTR